MLRLNSELMQLFAAFGPVKRKTASGTEIVLRDCPIDLKKKGSRHPVFKCYLNGTKGKVKCFVCHADGEGQDLEDLITKRPRRVVTTEVEEEESNAMAPIPPSIPVVDITDGRHPAWLYLQSRRISFEAVRDSGLRWKNPGVPSWEKVDEDGDRFGTCKMSGLIIPVTVRDQLMGWQICPVPRIKDFLKYITAPGSSFPLYNYDHVVRVGAKVVVVCEGVFDVLTLHNIAVGIFTDKINDRKKRLIKAGNFEEIILCLDDDRGDRHVQREIAKLIGCAPTVRSVRLPGGDPNDYNPGDLVQLLGLEGKELFR